MVSKWATAVAFIGLFTTTAGAQDARTVLGNAVKAMGVESLNSIHYYGTGANGNLGQNNNANQPWPMAPLNDYVRAIDFTQPASRASAVTFGVPVTGGAAVQGSFNQNITPANQAWAQ